MIGEIRDETTAVAAVKAAETGHVVLSTLHVKNAAATITRLRGLGIALDQITTSVNLIIAQRLLRTLCKSCGGPQAGCPRCFQTGWAGRSAVMEALQIDEQVIELLNEPTIYPSKIRDAQVSKFADHAAALINAGETTLEEAQRVLGPAAPTTDRLTTRFSLVKP